MKSLKQTNRGGESRRLHKKTRSGCLICKQRRIKCDEGRPRCRNCAIRNRPCSYSKQATRTLDAGFHGDSPAGPREATSTTRGLGTRGTFTALHLKLFYHAVSHMARFMALAGDIDPIIDIALDTSTKAPYVLDQLLALSALHRAFQEPHAATCWADQATELQTRPLGLFNEGREHMSEDNYMTSFIFANLLGIHVLRDTLADHYRSAVDFVRAFVNYAHIHRGVRTMTDKFKQSEQIHCSKLEPLVYRVEGAKKMKQPQAGTETVCAQKQLESSLDPSTKPSLQALICIQWMLDDMNRTPESGASVHAVMAWPLVVPEEYIDAVYQHRPEALAVMAYFGAALHRHREFWAFGDSGSRLVKLLVEHVGPFWSDVLAWPVAAIAGS